MEIDDLYKKAPMNGNNLDRLLSIVTPRGQKKINDDDFQSDTSFVDETTVNINDAFGNPEVETRNEFPLKGYKYMLFCFAMAIFLSVLVIIDGPVAGPVDTVSLSEIVGDVTVPL